MKLDQLVELAERESSKLKDTVSIIGAFRDVKTHYDTVYKDLKDQLSSKLDNEIKQLSELKKEFIYSSEGQHKRVIQVGSSKIFLKFDFGYGAKSKFGVQTKLNVERSDTNSVFFIELSPSEDFKAEPIDLDYPLNSKIERYGQQSNKELSTSDLTQIENYIQYLKLNIEYIENLKLEDCMYYLIQNSNAFHRPIFDSFSFQEVLEKALSLAPNLK
ncbi:hypothetical protein [Acinetobacter lwoffii]|uniref:Uncharacterized protein n=1 Tax=Acinetobacter lwoffii TaxID=28090 RepID=A0A6N1MI48_ACILW|nr:hypothetical protein [Acinetobacter lwoffii]QKU21859.1 hypothetical protein FOB19_10885 [Acinetobacter lwoffii]